MMKNTLIETPPPSNAKRTDEQTELLNIEAQIRHLIDQNKVQIRKKKELIKRYEREIDNHENDLERLRTFNIK